MQKLLLLILLALFVFETQAQDKSLQSSYSRKGDFYIYWGWNRGWFTDSDISFRGNGNDFTLYDVVAKDRQSEFAWDPYFKISRLTIPQYNLRIGYFFNEHYSVSFGVDHMKYVMVQNQTVKISGHISEADSTYGGDYNGDDIVVANDLLLFEHTDGLNYLNFELRRYDELFSFFEQRMTINLTEGFGAGVLMPKTNATLLSNPRNDEFHLAGFGLGAVVGANVTFWRHFFIQGEFKVGYINMPDIRTTPDPADKASQHFWFSQLNMVFGFKFNIHGNMKAAHKAYKALKSDPAE